MKSAHGVPLSIAATFFAILASILALAQEPQLWEPYSAPAGYIMKFERMGGFAGFHDRFWIYPDGKIINGAGKAASVPTGVVEAWLKRFSPIVAPRSTAATASPSLCMDCIVYQIIIYDKAGAKFLLLSDPLSKAPNTAGADMVQMLNRLLHLFNP